MSTRTMMATVYRRACLLGWLLMPSFALASRQDEEAAACAACSGMLMVPIILAVVAFALQIALLVWVARDAKARGMDSGVLWMALVMFTSLIGLLIYVFSRPQGNVVQCSSCHNKRLQASAKCPHCGNA